MRITARTLALLTYAAVMTAYVYGFEHRADADYARETGADELILLSAVGALHVALGAVVGRWPVLVAPMLTVLIAIPAGDYPGGWPELPVAMAILYQAVLYGIPLVAVGVTARTIVDRRRLRSRRRARAALRSGSP